MLSSNSLFNDSSYHRRLMQLINVHDDKIQLPDHLNGFDQSLTNRYLKNIETSNKTVFTEYFVDDRLSARYPNLEFDLSMFLAGNYFDDLAKVDKILITNYRGTQQLFNNFACSFNGSPNAGRMFLVAAMSKFNLFNEEYCSKQFVFDQTDLNNYLDVSYRMQSLFFDASIGHKIINFQYSRVNHQNNYYVLSPKIVQSFLHIVSESIATSSYPFITEKFLYSIVNRGLFLAYAQPGWHDFLEKYLGFKKYDKIFDYSFDSIVDPIDRLIALLTMVSKFAILSKEDWRFLHASAKETLDYNYNHYINGKYIIALRESGQLK